MDPKNYIVAIYLQWIYLCKWGNMWGIHYETNMNFQSVNMV